MFLLDSSAAIALFASNHADHKAVEDWATGRSALAMCPVSEGALVRYLVRCGVPASLARSTLAQVYDQPGWEFVADAISYGQANLDAVSGHRQVTDAYLVSLAKAIGAGLATLDQALAALYPETAALIPTAPVEPTDQP